MFTTRLKNMRKRIIKLEKKQENIEEINTILVKIFRLFAEYIEAVEEQKLVGNKKPKKFKNL